MARTLVVYDAGDRVASCEVDATDITWSPDVCIIDYEKEGKVFRRYIPLQRIHTIVEEKEE